MSDRGRRLRRALGAVGLFLSVFQSTAQDAPASAPAATEPQVQACVVTASLPTPPAEARGGGFGFVFESVGGTAVDGRACTVYRLRNLPGSPPTPVRWSAGSEVLVDLARLGRCEDDCQWFEVARYFDGEFTGGDTLVSYGLNADSFSLQSPGLVTLSAPDTDAVAASIGTEIVGTVVTSTGEEVSLDLVVKSRIVRGEGGLMLVYEATADDPGQLSGEDFVLAWEAFDQLPDGALTSGLEGALFRRAATDTPVAPKVEGPGAVGIEVTAGSATFQDGLSLTVMTPGPEGEALLTVLLPAFLPER